jgi:acyl carrier protein
MDSLIEQLKKRIIEILNLEDIVPDDIDASAPLFGEGLGLDSLDALELVVMLEKDYSITITDIEVGSQAFASITSMAEFIREHRP